MKIKKPLFWDNKKPNLISYLMLPFTFPVIINNFLLSQKVRHKKNQAIKTICLGNIYIGGTGKTPLVIKLNKILTKLNYKTAVIKKFYKNQGDEQKILKSKTNFYCEKKRMKALDKANNDKNEIALFDDGLQDKSISYDLSFVCFNDLKGLGNGFLIPAGPLRENANSLIKYDGAFINGNNDDNTTLKKVLKIYNPNIEIFETCYVPQNMNKISVEEKYLVFSGIGNPDSFKKTLSQNNLNIVHEIKFPDHYQYKDNDIKKIKFLARQLGAKIITTEKDYVKIEKGDQNEILFLSIDLLIKNEDKLISFIKSKI